MDFQGDKIAQRSSSWLLPTCPGKGQDAVPRFPGVRWQNCQLSPKPRLFMAESAEAMPHLLASERSGLARAGSSV
jgi:hypothetical protein